MMKMTTLALSAFSLAVLTAAQNGNDPLILNNRTGLAPVVYATYSTSYTLGGTPLPQPTDDARMGILPSHVSLAGASRAYDAPPRAEGKTGEVGLSVLPVTMSTPAGDMSTISRPQQSKGPEEIIDCTSHYCTPGVTTLYTITSTPYTSPLPASLVMR